MVNQALKFASQQEASAQLAERIDSAQEQPQGQLSEEQRKQLEGQLTAGDERIKAQNESDAAKLGEVAASREVHVAPNGVVLTEKEHQDVLARRQAA